MTVQWQGLVMARQMPWFTFRRSAPSPSSSSDPDDVGKNLKSLEAMLQDDEAWMDDAGARIAIDAQTEIGKKEIKDFLKFPLEGAMEEKLSVVPIVGAAGVGKTTLVQKIDNDPEVSEKAIAESLATTTSWQLFRIS